MKNFVVYKEHNRYSSFPHIARTANGRLIVCFRIASQFSADAAKKGLATHHDPDSAIAVAFSDNQGESWTKPKIVYKGEFGVNDPAITVLQDGSMLLRFVALKIVNSANTDQLSYQLFSHREEHGLAAQVEGNFLLRSTDHGESWAQLGVARGPREKFTRGCSRDPVVELTDGSYLMGFYTGAPQRSDISWVMKSFDQGKTWREPTVVMIDPAGAHSQFHGVNYNETSLLPLGRGEILALVRGDTSFHTEDMFMPVGGVGELYSARSLDGGLCWTPPRKTGIWGQPGSLLKMQNGDILATYGYRKKPFGVRACISRDKGISWDLNHEIIIRSDSPTWDVGYPFSLELEPGLFLTVYYFVDENQTRFVAATRWSL